MNLTYRIEKDGYTILKDNKDWIRQDSYMPFAGKDVEESAQNHIVNIIEEDNKRLSEVSELEQLKITVEEQENALIELATMIAEVITVG